LPRVRGRPKLSDDEHGSTMEVYAGMGRLFQPPPLSRHTAMGWDPRWERSASRPTIIPPTCPPHPNPKPHPHHRRDRRRRLTGHSLGGAVAALLGLRPSATPISERGGYFLVHQRGGACSGCVLGWGGDAVRWARKTPKYKAPRLYIWVEISRTRRGALYLGWALFMVKNIIWGG